MNLKSDDRVDSIPSELCTYRYLYVFVLKSCLFVGEEDISSLSGKIVECSWDSDSGSWVCMRIRTDKSTPNDINTYRKVNPIQTVCLLHGKN